MHMRCDIEMIQPLFSTRDEYHKAMMLAANIIRAFKVFENLPFYTIRFTPRKTIWESGSSFPHSHEYKIEADYGRSLYTSEFIFTDKEFTQFHACYCYMVATYCTDKKDTRSLYTLELDPKFQQSYQLFKQYHDIPFFDSNSVYLFNKYMMMTGKECEALYAFKKLSFHVSPF